VEILKYITLWGWVFPSAIITTHTLISLMYIRLTPRRGEVPVVVGIGFLVCMYSNFEMRIYTYPKRSHVFYLLGAGLVPVVSIGILVCYLFFISLFVVVNMDDSKF
jgi:hypothetical protein